MIIKCPYCSESIPNRNTIRCVHCLQFFIDDLIEVDFPTLEKKNCIFCGKKIIKEAIFCRFCRRWLDEVDRAVQNIDPEDLV